MMTARICNRFRETSTLLLVLAPALAGCAHSPPASNSIPAKDTAMATPVVTPHENPTLTAEEIGQRFLKLIEGLKSRDDLSLERIRDVTGITLTHEPGAPRAAVGSDDLGGGWHYVLDYVPGSSALPDYVPGSPALLKGVGLSFEHEKDGFSDMSAVCGLDFDHYHNALVSMGFLAEPHYGEIGELRSWRYTKFKESDGTVDMTISIIPQNMVSGKASRLCVKSIGTLN